MYNIWWPQSNILYGVQTKFDNFEVVAIELNLGIWTIGKKTLCWYLLNTV